MRGRAAVLTLRTIDAELYHQFCAGDASDKDVVEKVGGAFTAEKTQAVLQARCNFEAVIISAQMKIAKDNDLPSISPLLQKYKSLTMESGTSPEQEHAGRVIKQVQHWNRQARLEYIGGEFQESVQRIELLSPNLDGLGENG